MIKKDNGLMNQYLTFLLDAEVYGLDIAKVREVLELLPITKVPKSAPHMLGVINLRGHAVPVVDLRSKLGMRSGERSVDTCIVIFETLVRGESLVCGAVVDGVREVYELPAGRIEPPPGMGGFQDGQYLVGMGRQDERFIMLLDIDSIFSDDVQALAAATDQMSETAEQAA